MTYRPTETVFLPPWRVRLPSLVYLVIALAIGAVVLAAEASSSNSELYVWVIENNSRRIIGPETFAILLGVSAIATVLRTGMRGVRVHGDGLEYRDVVSLFIPKRRRYRWAQIDGISLRDPKSIGLDLWDGTRVFLPPVSDHAGLAATLEKVGAARAIPVQGGRGLDDIPESGDFGEDVA
ncbi:MAG: PH domain-containing protein [Polyangiaceae bacterium]|nr:PH domain-containing protein [Polyangiaceae bacterium]